MLAVEQRAQGGDVDGHASEFCPTRAVDPGSRGPHDHRAAAAAAHGLGRRVHAARRRAARSRWRRRAPRSRRNAWPRAGERRRRRASAMNAGSASVVALLRCDARGSAIASGSDMPRSKRLTRICRTVVMIVEPPGEPSASTGRAAAQHDRRATSTSAAACAAAGEFGSAGVEVEVGQLVVEQEAAAGHDDAAAAGLLDRERVGDDHCRAGRRRSGGWCSGPRCGCRRRARRRPSHVARRRRATSPRCR